MRFEWILQFAKHKEPEFCDFHIQPTNKRPYRQMFLMAAKKISNSTFSYLFCLQFKVYPRNRPSFPALANRTKSETVYLFSQTRPVENPNIKRAKEVQRYPRKTPEVMRSNGRRPASQRTHQS